MPPICVCCHAGSFAAKRAAADAAGYRPSERRYAFEAAQAAPRLGVLEGGHFRAESDPKGAGYNVLQSKIAIGSGELTGMGLLNGNQTQLGYLSPKTTDFIYSVVGEEMGFIISAAVILVYVTLITKSLYVAKTASDDLGSYIAAGISGIFLFHMAENIGMTLGLLPITGVPLLFISYGGSSMITSYICIGLLLNISGNRKKTIFIK